jgi:hypothetical protein
MSYFDDGGLSHEQIREFDRQNAETDRLLRKLQQRQPKPEPEPEPKKTHELRQAIGAMTNAAWNDWADQKIAEALDDHADMLADVLGEELKKADAAISQLKTEIGQLRAELTLMQGIQRSSNVTELKRNVDAA